MKTTISGRESGVALITTILMVAIATVAAVAMANRMQLDIRRTGNLLHSLQARSYTEAAESWGFVILARDARDSQTDHLGEDWAIQVPVSMVEGGSIRGRLVDMQGRYNLNNLVDTQGEVNKESLEYFKRLLKNLGIEVELADALVDWIDKDINVRFPDGAEDDYYLSAQPAYRAANRPLANLTELRLVKGFDQKTVEILSPYLCVLPLTTAINVNTAPAQVLRALADDLTESDAESLIEGRDEEGYPSVSELLDQPVMNGKDVKPELLGVSSQWFYLLSVAEIGQARAEQTSLIYRVGEQPHLVDREWVIREPVSIEQKEEQ